MVTTVLGERLSLLPHYSVSAAGSNIRKTELSVAAAEAGFIESAGAADFEAGRLGCSSPAPQSVARAAAVLLPQR